jgi:hypothetical protein
MVGTPRRGGQRARRPCAGAEQPERQLCRTGLGGQPVDGAHQPPRQKIDVEAQRRRLGVQPFLVRGEQVQQQRAEPGRVQP